MTQPGNVDAGPEASEHPGPAPSTRALDSELGLPTIDEVRVYVGVPATVLPDDDLERIYAAELEVQTRTCRTPVDTTTWPAALAQALLRRIQRQIAGKNLPLGYMDPAGDYGPARIPQYDAMVENLEGTYRVVVFG